MKNAFIIHSSYADPESHWYPWVAQSLKSRGYEVFVPHFPTPENQSLGSWNALFEPYREHINAQTLFIGHSIGCAFILRQLESYPDQIAGCIFVAPFVEATQHDGLNLVTATFLTQPFDWFAINQTIARVSVIGSDDDAFVGAGYTRQVAELLGTVPTLVPEGGHFTRADTMQECPVILAAVDTLTTKAPTENEQAFDSLNVALRTAGIDMSIMSPGIDAMQTDPVRDEAYTIADESDDGLDTMYEHIADTISTSSAKAMADMLQEDHQKRKAKEAKRKQNIINVIFTAVAVIFIGTGIVLVNKARTYVPETISVQESTFVIPTPFRINESVLFDLSLYSSVFQVRDALETLLDQNIVPNKTIMHIYPGIRTLGIGSLASISEFFEAFEITLPMSLRPSIADTFTYGVHGGTVGQSMFLLLDITSIDQSFIGMKDWEQTLTKDMLSILNVPDTVRQPSLYELPFTDELLLNTPMRVLRAPTVTKQITTEIREEKIQEIPQHALPNETLTSIIAITDSEIIFGQPDAFLSTLTIGDIITADTSALHRSFIRRIDNFVRTEESFKIITTTLDLKDIRPDIRTGAKIVRRAGETGSLVRYMQYEEEVTSYVQGNLIPVLYYGFLGSTHIVIATGLDAIEAIIQRLGESEG